MEAKTTRRSGFTLVAGVLACAGIGALGGTVRLCARWSEASTSLERRALDLRGEIAAWRARPSARPARGGTVIDGDAVDRYRVALWALADASSPRPARGSTTLEPVRGVDLDALLARANDSILAGRPLDEGDLAALEAYEPVVELLRDGLRCDRCDWQLDPTGGPAAETLDMDAVTRAAKLLALAAELEVDGGIAARGCLDVVAFGADVARLETLRGVVFGANAKRLGLEALERVLAAHRLSAEQYAEVSDAVRALGPTDLRLEGERLMFAAAWAAISDHPVGPGKPRDSFAERYEHLGLIGPIGFEREWIAFELFMEEVLAVAALAPDARGDDLAVIGDAATSFDAWLVRFSIPRVVNGVPTVDAANQLAERVGVVAADLLAALPR